MDLAVLHQLADADAVLLHQLQHQLVVVVAVAEALVAADAANQFVVCFLVFADELALWAAVDLAELLAEVADAVVDFEACRCLSLVCLIVCVAVAALVAVAAHTVAEAHVAADAVAVAETPAT